MNRDELENETIIILKYLIDKDDNMQVCGYEKTNKHTLAEIKDLILKNNSRSPIIHKYRLFKEAPIEDIQKAFLMCPEKSDVQETMERIEDMLDDVTREFGVIRSDLEREKEG